MITAVWKSVGCAAAIETSRLRGAVQACAQAMVVNGVRSASSDLPPEVQLAKINQTQEVEDWTLHIITTYLLKHVNIYQSRELPFY